MADRIRQLALVKKVSTEIKNHWQIDDKDLAEFVIDLAQNTDSLDSFKEDLAENGATATDEFAAHLFELISKMAPPKIVANGGSSSGIGGSSGSTLGARAPKDDREVPFAGLRLQNVNPSAQPDVYEAGFAKKDVHAAPDGVAAKLLLEEMHPRDRERKGKGKKGKDGLTKGGKGAAGTGANDIPLGGERERDGRRDGEDPSRGPQLTVAQIRRESRNKPLERWGIYAGTVQKIMEFGAFVSIETSEGRKEGLCHAQQLPRNSPGQPTSEMVSRHQEVLVKVTALAQSKISLSMVDVDQNTGEDLKPRDKDGRLIQLKQAGGYDEAVGLGGRAAAARANAGGDQSHGTHTGVPLHIADTLGGKRKDRAKRKLNDYDLWENRQMVNAGAVTAQERMDFDEQHGFLVDDEVDEEFEVEAKDKEPSFLVNQTARSGQQLESVKLVKMPEGTLAQSAANAAGAAKERREARDAIQQETVDAIPKDMSRPWDDPAPGPGQRTLAQQFRGLADNKYEAPEWKKMYQKNAVSYGQRSSLPMKEQREGLPIFKLRNALLQAFADNQILIVIGETGSGKTTQMPQYLAESGYTSRGIVGCTQPRRVAAMSVAKRVAEEYGCRLGQEVGYSIRFEDMTSRDTVIKYMTDGHLLREILDDSTLAKYSLIMIDEAHERSLATDMLFPLLKECVKKRPEFRLVVTSATLDAEKFSNYYFGSKIFRIPGRTYPVEINYALEPSEDNYVDMALLCVMEIHLKEPAGDILLFLTGQEEIDTAAQMLHERMKALEAHNPPPLIVLPVYSALPSEMQSEIFVRAPPGCRKCVIATNIAEASLTIDGIFYVVDPGMAKQNQYNAKTGMNSLVVVPISQASAKQRAGRAGRTGPGKCYRLYTELAYKNEMMPMNVPEIQRTNLASWVLVVKAMGINDLLGFDFMDAPPIQTLINAMESLWTLGALDDEGSLTRLGRKMADFPLDPAMSKTLLVGVDLSCADETVTVMAMLQVQNVFYRPRDKQTLADQKKSHFHQAEGDHITLLEVYKGWARNRFASPWCFENFVQVRSLKRAQEVRKQLIGILDRFSLEIKSCGTDYNRLRKTLCAGYFNHACKRDPKDEGYKTLIDNQTVFIHPSSSLYQKAPEWIIYHELIFTTKEYLREVTTIEPHWLPELAPNLFQKADNNKISKRKMQETIAPLYNKFEDANSWRLSRRQG